MSGAMTPSMQRRLFGRSLLLQAFWSFERMQSLGFAFCLDPWIERCWSGRDEEIREARLRHQEYFNTQPYMASLVIGMVCALEEAAAGATDADRPAKIERLKALKSAAAAALAGVGDAMFWGALRPFCAALALTCALALRQRPMEAAVCAAGVYLIAHNAPALWLRWRFLRLGYEWKDQIAVRLKSWPGQKAIRALRASGLALALVSGVLLLGAVPAPQRPIGLLALVAALLLSLARVSAYRIYAAAAGAGYLAYLAGWM